MLLPLDTSSYEALLTSNSSYEALSSDFTVANNMVAGAFAGVAVSSFAPDKNTLGWKR